MESFVRIVNDCKPLTTDGELSILDTCESPDYTTEMFYKIGVFTNFAKFTGKPLRRSIFLNKVVSLQSGTLLKKRLHISFKMFKILMKAQ